MSSFITVNNLYKSYGRQQVLRDINLEIGMGEKMVIRGASGSGKSTFLYILGGLETLDKGNVRVSGKPIHKLEDSELAQYRNSEIGFVFQFHFLLPSINCIENILLPSRIGGQFSTTVEDRVYELAETLKVTDILSKFPYEISGGEQQRINIIRALSLRPKILLCDEPTGNLDSKNSQIVTDLLVSLADSYQSTLVVVTHDQNVASHFPKKYEMLDGQLVQ